MAVLAIDNAVKNAETLAVEPFGWVSLL